MAKVISREEKIKEAWLAYFKNIEKENAMICLILEYFKEIEIEVSKIESNSSKQKDEEYESVRERENFKQNYKKTEKKEKLKSILPKYIQFVNKKELRQYLLLADNMINELSAKTYPKNIKNLIEHYNKLRKNIEESERENKKPEIEKNSFTSLYLENFKGFAQKEKKEENTINIRPITLIYGPNSYGKSSILQSLLLLNQTVREGESYKNTALLSQGNTVTLGKFKNFINKNDTDKELKIEISLPYNHYFDKTKKDSKQAPSILAKLFFGYRFKLNKEQVILSSIDISAKLIDYDNTEQIVEINKKLLYTLEAETNQNSNILYKIIRHFKDDIINNEIFLGDTNEIEETNKTSFFKFEEFLTENPFEQIEEAIRNIIYVSSFRKSPERYYIPDDNTRKYVGKCGEYTAGILSYDDDKIDENVNYWLHKIAGYKLASEKNNDDVNSVTLNDEKTKVQNINLLDLGSGIAQVLPIITQAFKSKNETILIEEPEIHLHPKAQAELGEMFKEAAKNNGNTFIIETHSENLLLRLEKLIRNKELSKDDVSVIYVDKNENGSYCIPLIIDDEGDIENINEIPDGFFEEGFNELFDIPQNNER